MPLKFGTSGVRGLVTEMTDRACCQYTLAYAQYLKQLQAPPRVYLAGDLRSSTPRIQLAVATALADAGFQAIDCGQQPTPALMAYATAQGCASVMITGSHIPEDRNGIKFNLPNGEVLKDDEARITAIMEERGDDLGGVGCNDDGSLADPVPPVTTATEEVAAAYRRRYLESFPPGCLQGLRLALYEHSAVGREQLAEILAGLGADVTRVGRSEQFVPVDTEAVQDHEQLAAWVAELDADALVSTDGDSDRPLVVDEQGKQVRGDVMGILVSQQLAAHTVATPVSCNTGAERCGAFQRVVRTRIGSPYVIAAMREQQDAAGPVVGYEANGGYLTNTDIHIQGGQAPLSALPTRDAVLPIVALLHRAHSRAQSLSALCAELPARYTASGLLREFPASAGKALVHKLTDGGKAFVEKHLGEAFGEVRELDTTDGVRITFANERIVHLRPSGNAPEFRCYTESESAETAREMNDTALRILRDQLKPLVT